MFDFNELRLVNPAFLVESTRSYQLPYPIFGFYFVMYITLFNIVTKILLGVISPFFLSWCSRKTFKINFKFVLHKSYVNICNFVEKNIQQNNKKDILILKKSN